MFCGGVEAQIPRASVLEFHEHFAAPWIPSPNIRHHRRNRFVDALELDAANFVRVLVRLCLRAIDDCLDVAVRLAKPDA